MGDYSKAHAAFGWKPATTFRELVHLMTDSDIHPAHQIER